MKRRRLVKETRRRFGLLTVSLAGMLLMAGARAESAKGESAAAIGGGAVARVLSPVEKVRVLEDELAKEVERRSQAEAELVRRVAEHGELVAGGKLAAKDRAALETRLADTREREVQLQKANERLRAENERVAVTIRVALPIVALVNLALLGLLIWIFRYLRKVAERVHATKTIVEMHELEAKLTHAQGQIDAELRRNQTLRGKLAELGIVDEDSSPRSTGSWRVR